jgi:hypothetical protein
MLSPTYCSRINAVQVPYIARLISLLVLATCFRAYAQDQLTTYQNDKYGYRLTHPSSWTPEVSANGQQVVFFFKDKTLVGEKGYSVQVTVTDRSAYGTAGNMDVAALKQAILPQIQAMPVQDLQVSTSERKCGRYNGIYFDYTCTDKYRIFRHHISWVIPGENKLLYSVIYDVPGKDLDQKYLAIGESVVASFALPNSQAATNTASSATASGATDATALKAGDIAPDAIEMAVDEINPFFGGTAVIRKANLYALINAKGQIVQPYSKYSYSQVYKVYPRKGSTTSACQFDYKDCKKIRVAREVLTKNSIVLDVNGKPLPAPDIFAGSKEMYFPEFDAEGYYCFNSGYGSKSVLKSSYAGKDKLFVRFDNKIIATKSELIIKGSSTNKPNLPLKGASTRDGVTTYTIPRYTGVNWANGLQAYGPFTGPLIPGTSDSHQVLYGFINRSGNMVIKPVYNRVSDFSQGLCFVSKLNEFGEERWGVIDTLGKSIIPHKYVKQPGHFSNNRALVTSYGTGLDEYSYINKAGQIVIRLPRHGSDTTYHFISFRKLVDYSFRDYNTGDYYSGDEKGLFSEGYCLLNIKSSKSPQLNGVCRLDTAGNYFPLGNRIRQNLGNNSYGIRVDYYSNQHVIFSCPNSVCGSGIADIDGNIVLPPIFQNIRLFEDESPLQYATRNPRNSSEKPVEGYIDRKGVFRIIRVTKSGDN